MDTLGLSYREALEQVVAHLQYQQYEYERLPVEQRKGHVWEAVRVLQSDLMRQRRHELQVSRRQVNGPVQGY